MANKKNTILTKHQEDVLIAITMDDVREKIIVLQAVKNNPGKFPFGYIMGLDEFEKNELVKNFDWFNILKHSTAKSIYRKRFIYDGNYSKKQASRTYYHCHY